MHKNLLYLITLNFLCCFILSSCRTNSYKIAELEMQIRELQRAYATTAFNIDSLAAKMSALEQDIGTNKSEIQTLSKESE